MANVITNKALQGTHPYGSTVYQQSSILVNNNPAFYGSGQWNFFTNQYTYLGSVFASTGSNIVNSFKFTNDQYGCRDFELRLTEQPSFPVQANTIMQFGHEDDIYFLGYVSEYPQPGESRDGLYVYRGFGGLRYMDNAIYTGIKLGNINRVDKSGATAIYHVPDSSLTFNPQVGGYVAVSDASNSKNNGVYEITSVTYVGTNWEIHTNNVNGVNANPEIGLIKIYPLALSNTGTMVSDILKTISSEYIVESSSFVKYSQSNITDTTGILTGGIMDFYNKSYYDIIQVLNKFVEGVYRIGVDEFGVIFCKPYSSTPVDKFFIGFNAPSAELRLNLDGVKNYITVNRKKSSGSNQVGSEISIVPTNTSAVQESIGTYGKREYKLDLPGYYSDATCQSIANRLFSIYSNPRYIAKIPSLPFKKYAIDSYGVVSAYNENIVTLVNNCETTSGITFYNQNPTLQVFPVTQPSLYGTHQYGRTIYQQAATAFIGAITTSGLYVKGAKSVLIKIDSNFPTASWQPFIDIALPTNTLLANDFILSFYIYPNKFNVMLDVERGNPNYTTIPIQLAPVSQWTRYDISVKVNATTAPTYLRIYCKSLTSSFSFNIDNIVLIRSMNEHVNLNLYEYTGMLDPNSSRIDLSLGEDFNRLDNFLASIVNGQKTQGYYLSV